MSALRNFIVCWAMMAAGCGSETTNWGAVASTMPAVMEGQHEAGKFSGDYHVDNPKAAARGASITEITGDLLVDVYDTDLVIMPSLRRVGGSITVKGATGHRATTLELSAIECIDGDLSPRATSPVRVVLPKLQTVGMMMVVADYFLAEVPRLRSVGSLVMDSQSGHLDQTFPALARVDGRIFLPCSNAAFAALTRADVITGGDCQMSHTYAFPKLVGAQELQYLRERQLSAPLLTDVKGLILQSRKAGDHEAFTLLKRFNRLSSLVVLGIDDFLPDFSRLQLVKGAQGHARLEIRGSKVTHLKSLRAASGLENVTILSIENCSNLKTLAGLERIRDLANLNVGHCDNLQTLSGLGPLSTLGGLRVVENPKLQTMAAMGNPSAMYSPKSSFDYFKIERNQSLTTLEGLGGLKKLHGLGASGIQDNDSLCDVSALSPSEVTWAFLDGILYIRGNRNLPTGAALQLCKDLDLEPDSCITERHGVGG